MEDAPAPHSSFDERYERAMLFLDRGLHEEAIKWLHAALDGADPVACRMINFHLSDAHSTLGMRALNAGAVDRGLTHLRQTVELTPGYPDAHLNLAVAHCRALEYREALVCIDRSLEIHPQFARAHFQRGITLYALGLRDHAVDALHTAALIEPGFDTPAFRHALQAHSNGDFAAAIHALTTVSSTVVDDIQYYIQLGDDLMHKGSTGAAAEEYAKALDLNPTYPDVHNRLGVALMKDGKLDAAIESFKMAVSCNPRYVEAWLNLGLALNDAGLTSDATTAMDTARSLDPEYCGVRAAHTEGEASLAA